MSHNALPYEAILAAFSARFGDRLRRNELLANHTTLRLGGPADIWLAVGSVTELVDAVTLAQQYDVAVFILGGGANLLISDAGIRGLVIENRARRVDFPATIGTEAGWKVHISTESGCILPNLVRRCAKRGLSGLEWAVGVPGTVGGAVVNNAGAYGGDIARNLVQAEMLSPTAERVWQPASWFEYDYRSSRLKRYKLDRSRSVKTSNWVVLRAELQLTTAPLGEIDARLNAFNERRKASQPPGATIGSMFKNPPGDYAGRLIETVGLKGYRVGQAQISPVHANFFQNLGRATASDVMTLINTARNAVAAQLGVRLELEIEVIGEFDQETS